MKRPLVIIGLLLLAAIVGMLLLLRQRALLRNQAITANDTPTAPVTPPAPATPTPPATPGFAFTGETKFGYTDGQHIANHGTSYPVFARVVGGVLYAVGINKTVGQALYNEPVRLSRAWLTSMGQLGANTGAFADMPHQQADPAPLGAFAQNLLPGSAAVQPTGYSAAPATPTTPVVPTTPEAPTTPPAQPVVGPVATAPTPAPPVEPIPPAPPSEPVATAPTPATPVEPAPTAPIEPADGEDDFSSLIPDFEAGLNNPLPQQPA